MTDGPPAPKFGGRTVGALLGCHGAVGGVWWIRDDTPSGDEGRSCSLPPGRGRALDDERMLSETVRRCPGPRLSQPCRLLSTIEYICSCVKGLARTRYSHFQKCWDHAAGRWRGWAHGSALLPMWVQVIFSAPCCRAI